MFGIRPLLVVLFIVAVVLFAKRLPSIGKALGQSIRNFKKGLKGEPDDDLKSLNEKDDE